MDIKFDESMKRALDYKNSLTDDKIDGLSASFEWAILWETMLDDGALRSSLDVVSLMVGFMMGHYMTDDYPMEMREVLDSLDKEFSSTLDEPNQLKKGFDSAFKMMKAVYVDKSIRL